MAAAAISLSDVNLLDLDLFEDHEPYEVFEVLQREAPVYWHEGPEEGDGFWCVTRYDDVVHVLRQAELFSSEVNGTARIEWQDADVLAARRNFMETDAPRHTFFRRLFAKDFTPRAIGRYAEFLEDLTDRVLEPALERGEIDWVHDVASPIPIRVLGHILGIPEEHLDHLVELGDRMIIDTDPEIARFVKGSKEAEEFRFLPFGSEAAAELCAMGRPWIEERRRCPTEDVLSILANAQVDGELLGQVDLDNNFALFTVAGNETTRQGIALGLLALLRQPDALADLRAHPEIMPTAIDEILRIASPVWHFRRTATADTEIRGVRIRAGQRVVPWFAAANRDPEKFPDPHRLDLRRKRDEHATFGRGGPHFCLGAHLARLEVACVLGRLLERTADVELVGEPRRLRSNFTNGLKALPVRLVPA